MSTLPIMIFAAFQLLSLGILPPGAVRIITAAVTLTTASGGDPKDFSSVRLFCRDRWADLSGDSALNRAGRPPAMTPWHLLSAQRSWVLILPPPPALTLFRVSRASCAASRAGSALARSVSQAFCFSVTFWKEARWKRWVLGSMWMACVKGDPKGWRGGVRRGALLCSHSLGHRLEPTFLPPNACWLLCPKTFRSEGPGPSADLGLQKGNTAFSWLQLPGPEEKPGAMQVTPQGFEASPLGAIVESLQIGPVSELQAILLLKWEHPYSHIHSFIHTCMHSLIEPGRTSLSFQAPERLGEASYQSIRT